jgi:hypothetical protein
MPHNEAHRISAEAYSPTAWKGCCLKFGIMLQIIPASPLFTDIDALISVSLPIKDL